MGGFFHLTDLKQGRMARKFGTQKKNVGGLEAPRNSLELSVETCQSHYPPQDGQHKYQEPQDWSETSCYPDEAPMKKLINDEMLKRAKNRANSPSIVARLMGVDTLPLDTKSVTQRTEEKKEIPANDLSKEKLTRCSSVGSGISPSKSFRQTRLDSFHVDEDSDPDEWSGSSKKLMPREHPQEEELQKFKKEFEAWQSARFKECSKIVEHGSTPGQWMAQENLNNEKMALYANSGTKGQKLQDLKKSRSLKAGLHDRSNSYEFLSPDDKRSFPMRRKTLSEDFKSSLLRPDQETGAYSTPTRIVILRPGFDNISYPEEPWAASSSGASEDRNNIEDFLEEVKERLKFELQGKTFKRGGVVRGGGIETPYSERPSDPKQIAQRIAKQVRESVTKDLGANLLRSESTRSYRGESQCSGASSPEFISRDTRRLLSERLRNVLKRESHSNTLMDVENTSKSSILNRTLQSSDILKDENDIQSKSFRCGPDDMNMILQRDLSPINLVRSLSAPVSGTSFGKLLLEDRHVVTGAHIRRKHETNEKLTMKVKKQRKDKFNLKERVSSFKYSISLRARLFARKIHSATEFRDNDRSFVKDIMNGPTVTMNFAERPENSTEVPPSPASVCSSIHEDFYRAAYCVSPSTTPGAVTSDDNDLPQPFRDISSNLNELRKQLHQLETGRSEETVTEDQSFESDMVELEDEDEAYVRDLLIASGLYDNSFDKSLSRWDTFAKPITSRVFQQVEESHKHKMNHIEPKEQADQKEAHHKVLLDLLNEILSTILAPPIHISKFGRKVARLPRGNTLLNQVWGMLREYLHPPIDKSFYFFDTMVARDLRSMPWSELVSEDIDALTKEVECQIIRDLVEETVKDMGDDYGNRKV
ncbi:uncharacterized protein LOC112513174 [Cynara cardunculus var. scolymus]|uniref:uncharacterized protein LOC112513174 n=1 Tax=Cynara cardunculus var. scolymus TaxID=59895 RepID=UPI000D62B8DE|nr:uncharacterized protein LOC112513174 [Cynara cardunculus var. scolymus]